MSKSFYLDCFQANLKYKKFYSVDPEQLQQIHETSFTWGRGVTGKGGLRVKWGLHLMRESQIWYLLAEYR